MGRRGMYACIRGGPQKPVLAPRRLKIYCAKRNVYRVLVGKPEENRPLGKPRRRWVDNIKMDLGGIEWDGTEWIDLVQYRDQWRPLLTR
jgi:hypothetical protein